MSKYNIELYIKWKFRNNNGEHYHTYQIQYNNPIIDWRRFTRNLNRIINVKSVCRYLLYTIRKNSYRCYLIYTWIFYANSSRRRYSIWFQYWAKPRKYSLFYYDVFLFPIVNSFWPEKLTTIVDSEDGFLCQYMSTWSAGKIMFLTSRRQNK